MEASKFPTTAWTLVIKAGRQTDHESTNALATLCERYWFPIYAYVRRRGHAVEQAQDLTQEFFTRLLEKKYIERADRNKGRFRSFLLSSLKYFLSDDADRRNAEKRGGGRQPLSFEIGSGEDHYLLEPSHCETPERIFERDWAMALLQRVWSRMEEEFGQNGKPLHFERLKRFLAGQGAEVPYGQLAVELGTTEGALRVSVHRFKRRYRDLLRMEIAETVSTAGEIDEEIRYLMGALR